MSSVSLGQAPASPEPAPAPGGTLACGDGPLRLMAVHAHPDDESSKGAATMARYVREGVDVLVCTLTGGERGDILNKAMDRPEVRADLPGIRRAEMAMARDILGVRQQFLGFIDSGLPEGDPLPPLPDGCFALQPLEVAARPLVQAVREFRPHVILTYDENGGYPHPDHIMTHRVSVEAFEAAADPDRYPDCGEPWQPLKLYYFLTFHRARFTALHEKMIERGLESAYAERLADWADEDDEPGRPEYEITTRVPCADYFEGGLADGGLSPRQVRGGYWQARGRSLRRHPREGAAVTVLAASQSFLDQPGTVAFLVVFGMGVILFFVFRSMSKHLRKINMAARAEAEATARAQDGTAQGDSQDRAGTADRPA